MERVILSKVQTFYLELFLTKKSQKFPSWNLRHFRWLQFKAFGKEMCRIFRVFMDIFENEKSDITHSTDVLLGLFLRKMSQKFLSWDQGIFDHFNSKLLRKNVSNFFPFLWILLKMKRVILSIVQTFYLELFLTKKSQKFLSWDQCNFDHFNSKLLGKKCVEFLSVLMVES